MAQAPFDRGLVIVMDGMGETRGAMASDAASDGASSYAHDLQLPAASGFVEFPTVFDPHATYREAESVYSFELDRGEIRLARVYKRRAWCFLLLSPPWPPPSSWPHCGCFCGCRCGCHVAQVGPAPLTRRARELRI